MSGQSLWERVCATVTRLGQPKPSRGPVPLTRAPVNNQMVLDLHGHTVEAAYHAVREFLEHGSGARYVVVITGKSGEIRREFPFWMEKLGYSYEMAEHGGAFRVKR